MKKIMEQMAEELSAAFEKAGYDPSYGKVTVSNRPDCFSPLSLRANRAYAPISFVFHCGSYKTRKYARNTMYRIV